MCAKENEFKSLLISLCYFHAVVVERRKFGPQGWNRSYPYNTGDLTISVNVLYNYLENNAKVPWTDLRYLFGEIMYGGHITDDWDRKLCRTYLEEYMKPEQVKSCVDSTSACMCGGLLSPNIVGRFLIMVATRTIVVAIHAHATWCVFELPQTLQCALYVGTPYHIKYVMCCAIYRIISNTAILFVQDSDTGQLFPVL